MKKKLTAIFLVVALVAALLAGATLSYFTDKDTVTNTFTVGDVAIDVYETDETGAKVDGIEYDNVVPGVAYDKDPTIENTGKNGAYARMLVTVPALLDGTPLNELFVGLNSNFTFVGGIQGTDTVTYVFNYNGELAAKTTAKLFDKFVIPATLTQEEMAALNGKFNVVVEGQAIQADGFNSADDAFAALDGESSLGEITNAYPATAAELRTALAEGGNVVLMKDVSGMISVPAGSTAVLNLNGHKISNSGTAILNNGNLTIKNGNVVSTGNVAVGVGDNSFTTIESGSFEGREGAVITGYATGATINIVDGTYTAIDNAVIAGNGSSRSGDGNTINISGGTFNGGIVSSGYVACGIYAPWKDTINISGGTFNITGGAGIVARAGYVNVSGGTFKCTGTATGKVGDSRVVVPCSVFVFDSEANYPTLTDDSKITVTGGSYTSEAAVSTVIAAEGDTNTRIVLP